MAPALCREPAICPKAAFSPASMLFTRGISPLGQRLVCVCFCRDQSEGLLTPVKASRLPCNINYCGLELHVHCNPTAKQREEEAVWGSAVVNGLSSCKLLFSPAPGPAVQGKAGLERLRGPAQRHAPSARLV